MLRWGCSPSLQTLARVKAPSHILPAATPRAVLGEME